MTDKEKEVWSSLITEEQYKERFGAVPTNDDLERVNCNMAGNMGHSSCGYCLVHRKPRFVCGCTVYSKARS